MNRIIGLVALTAAFLPGYAVAQWSAVPSEFTTDSGSDARVRNDDGAELRIWLDVDNNLRAMFRLPPGLLILDPEGCPTLQIDRVKPENLAAPSHECQVSGDRAQVVLARVDGGWVESATLLDLMNGSRLQVRYRLAHAGYGAASFSLRGSKQALTTALGDDVAVMEE